VTNTEKLRAKSRTRLAELEKLWHEGQAFLLAKELEKGAPCPVCGSVEHPNKQTARTEPPPHERLEEVRREIEVRTRAIEDAQAAVQAFEKDRAQAEGQGKELGEQLGPLAKVDQTVFAEQLGAAKNLVKASQTAGVRLPDLLRALRETRERCDQVLSLRAAHEEATRVAAALIALRSKGETHEELAGLAGAMREAALSPQLPAGPPSIDIVGTGGDGAQTLNISTAAALLLAAAGLEDGAEPRARRWRVIKHGNRAISSSCGSADVLAALGVPMPMTPLAAGEMLELTGFTFLFAPHYHGATAAVQSVRRELGVRTVFNLLGPLTNPGRPDALLIGAASPRAAQLMALAAHALGQRATVVSPGGG